MNLHPADCSLVVGVFSMTQMLKHQQHLNLANDPRYQVTPNGEILLHLKQGMVRSLKAAMAPWDSLVDFSVRLLVSQTLRNQIKFGCPITIIFVLREVANHLVSSSIIKSNINLQDP